MATSTDDSSGITVEDVKAFIADCEKARDNWICWADRSWREIKKRSDNGTLWARGTNKKRTSGKYPVWNSTLKIRQPIIFGRIPVFIGEDTTQDGKDSIGATAAVLKERLAKSLIQDFDMLEVFGMARDDYLVTDFGAVRGYYSCKEIKEPVQIPIFPQKTPTGEVIFVNEAGEPVASDRIGQDESGAFFLESEETVDVEDERVFLGHVLYRDIYVDPDITRWEQRRRVAFATMYSRQAFKEIFGAKALQTLGDGEDKRSTDSTKKQNQIRVFEYWDDYEGEVKWLAEHGKDFIKPKKLDESEDGNGLYDLRNFFPMAKPLIINAPTDEFWPVPEYYQMVDILEDIHTLFSRMVALTKAIRARLLFDSSVENLQAALNEAWEGDAFGVAGLAAALNASGGSLEGVVQYIPVEKLIQCLEHVYKSLDQRLNAYFQLSGTSDLLRGQTDQVQRTYGEQQMKEKYALNQIAERQWKMQVFIAESVDVACEIALKNCSRKTLDRYIIPATLDEKHRANYEQGLSLLQRDSARFRLTLETDSTIAMNEEYDKAARVEMVNALTAALEKTAQTATTNPALAIPELHCLKYLVQGFRQGKLFQDEITQAIDQVIEQAKNATPPFDAKLFDAQNKAKVDEARIQTERFKAEVDAFVQKARLALDQSNTNFDNQLALMKFAEEQKITVAELQERWATEGRLMRQEQREEAQMMMGAAQQNAPKEPSAPQVIVMPAPQVSGPTIINAPNPEPKTTVVQPVETVPIPIL